MTKHSSGWCGVNKNLVRWKLATDDRCPRCKEPQETTTHVWTCQAVEANALWEIEMNNIQEWGRKNHTCPAISESIIANLNAWRNQTPKPVYRGTFPGMRSALAKQDKISWEAAFMGRWSIEWMEIQNLYYTFIGSRRSGKCWQVALSKQLWEVAFRLWEQCNKVNLATKEEAERLEYQAQLIAEYQIGWSSLHPTSQRLFTSHTREARSQQNNQVIASWLLRVKQAREWATQATCNARYRNEQHARQVQRQRTERQHTRAQQQMLQRTISVEDHQLRQSMTSWLRK